MGMWKDECFSHLSDTAYENLTYFDTYNPETGKRPATPTNKINTKNMDSDFIEEGKKQAAKFWNEVVEINKWNQERISSLITKKLFGTLSGKKIAILGFAFKSNTNDTRESAAIQICKDLLDEGAILSIHDPKVSIDQIEKDLNLEATTQPNTKSTGTWNFYYSIYEAFKNADGIVILTEWEEFKNYDWSKIDESIKIFDGRNFIKNERIKKIGKSYL